MQTMQTNRMTVAKFGGTSLGTSFGFECSRRWIKSGENVRVVVASAPGKAGFINRASKYDNVKVTDRLYEIRRLHALGLPYTDQAEAIATRFSEIERGMIVRGVSHTVEEQIDRCLRTNDDSLIVLGEFLNARLMVNYLNETGVPAVFADPGKINFMVQRNGDVWEVDRSRYGEIEQGVMGLANKEKKIIVTPGFCGIDKDGAIWALSRGGSDYTGIVIAVALHGAHLNGTDTDGMNMVEPEVAKNALRITNLTNNELFWLTRGGKFGIFQDMAAAALLGHDVPVRVVDTFNIYSEGTTVTATLQNDGRFQVAGMVPRGDSLVSLVGEKIGSALVDEAASILEGSGAVVKNVFKDGINLMFEIANMTATKGVRIVYRNLVPQ